MVLSLFFGFSFVMVRVQGKKTKNKKKQITTKSHTEAESFEENLIKGLITNVWAGYREASDLM